MKNSNTGMRAAGAMVATAAMMGMGGNAVATATNSPMHYTLPPKAPRPHWNSKRVGHSKANARAAAQISRYQENKRRMRRKAARA